MAERLKARVGLRQALAFREGLGMELLPAGGGTSSAFGVLAQRLRAGTLVCLVRDGGCHRRGVEVGSFGEKTRGGADRRRADVRDLVVEGDGWACMFMRRYRFLPKGTGEQQAAAMMQETARLFEAGIGAHPQDWHMLQRVFVADLDPRAAAARGSELGSAEAEAGR